MGNLSRLKTCNNSVEAQLLKGALRAEGITCLISNEYFKTGYGKFNTSPIEIMVSCNDMAKATSIMNEVNTEVHTASVPNVEWSFG